MSWKNTTSVTELTLLGFSVMYSKSLVLFCLVTLCYILTMAENILILFLVFMNRTLKRPMYYFLCNLSIMEICFTNSIVPKMLQGFLTKSNTISLTCCFIQMYTYFLVGSAEFFLFAVMSYDRYVAICHPLNYSGIMNECLCLKLIVGVWVGSFCTNLIPSILIIRITLCFNIINHFFCDVAPFLQNSCTDTAAIQILLAASSSTLFISFLITFMSYLNIILAIFKIPSVKGRKKAFSTCSAHALVVTLIYGSCIFIYAKPIQAYSTEINKQVAMVNTVVVPLINPLIYTLRNQNVREIIKIYLQTGACLPSSGNRHMARGL